MQQEYYPAAEKILADVESIFKKDSKLSQFEIIPVMSNENKSPVHHNEHCLGLERWCVPHVYCHAYSQIMNYRRSKTTKEDPVKTSRLLMGALMINPDITSFWNMRKDLICRGKIDLLFELHLTAVVLSRKPKCDDIFNHRKWIIKRMLKEFQLDDSLLRNELEVCEMAADRYANNYHAWSHRLWCLGQVGVGKRSEVMSSEWAKSFKWVCSHVSDYSGFHYRSSLLGEIIAQNLIVPPVVVGDSSLMSSDDTPHPIKLILADLSLNADLIRTYPGHETLWSHRRTLFHLLSQHSSSPSHHLSDGVPLTKDYKLDSDGASFILAVKRCEQSFAADILKKSANCRQKTYVEKHVEWLGKVLEIYLNFDNFK